MEQVAEVGIIVLQALKILLLLVPQVAGVPLILKKKLKEKMLDGEVLQVKISQLQKIAHQAEHGDLILQKIPLQTLVVLVLEDGDPKVIQLLLALEVGVLQLQEVMIQMLQGDGAHQEEQEIMIIMEVDLIETITIMEDKEDLIEITMENQVEITMEDKEDLITIEISTKMEIITMETMVEEVGKIIITTIITIEMVEEIETEEDFKIETIITLIKLDLMKVEIVAGVVVIATQEDGATLRMTIALLQLIIPLLLEEEVGVQILEILKLQHLLQEDGDQPPIMKHKRNQHLEEVEVGVHLQMILNNKQPQIVEDGVHLQMKPNKNLKLAEVDGDLLMIVQILNQEEVDGDHHLLLIIITIATIIGSTTIITIIVVEEEIDLG